jgi:hypothetical protein
MLAAGNSLNCDAIRLSGGIRALVRVLQDTNGERGDITVAQPPLFNLNLMTAHFMPPENWVVISTAWLQSGDLFEWLVGVLIAVNSL